MQKAVNEQGEGRGGVVSWSLPAPDGYKPAMTPGTDGSYRIAHSNIGKLQLSCLCDGMAMAKERSRLGSDDANVPRRKSGIAAP